MTPNLATRCPIVPEPPEESEFEFEHPYYELLTDLNDFNLTTPFAFPGSQTFGNGRELYIDGELETMDGTNPSIRFIDDLGDSIFHAVFNLQNQSVVMTNDFNVS